MKTKRFLILGLLATAFVCHAQQPLALQKINADHMERAAAIEEAGQQQQFFNPQNVPATPIAEEITEDIQQLARDLENDPLRIFNYVHDHIRHVLYFGSKKGAELTLLEKSGNEFDQCALLVALLRAANYTNCGYQFGWMELPYDSGDHKDLRHWLQLSLSNTNWNTTSNYLDNLVRVYRGYPATAAIWGADTFGFQRTWVVLTNGATVYFLDPAFKIHEPIGGIDLQTATDFNSNSVMSAAAGTDTGNYVTNLNEANLRGTLAGYTTNLLNYIKSNAPNASVAEILSGWQIVPSTNTTLSQTLPFTTYEWGGQMPILNWANQPTNLMSRLTVAFGYTNFTCFMPQLKGQRLTLAFDFWSYGFLYLEDTEVAEDYAYTGEVAVRVNHPIGYWDTNNNDFVDTTAYDQGSTNSYLASDGNPPYYNIYNIAYAFEPDWGWLQQRQTLLDYYRQYPLADDNFWVYAETLNIMGLQYALQSWYVEQILTAQSGVLPQNHHFFGRAAQEGGHGYYFDFFMWRAGDISGAGVDAANSNRAARVSGVVNYFASALEHGVIEQSQNSNYVAASTIKMLQIANANKQAIFLASSTNWQTGFNVRNKLTGYTSGELSTFDALITLGDTLLIPGYGNNLLDGGGSWGGFGYVDHIRPGNDGMIINGLYGGAVSFPSATVNPRYVSSASHAQPRRKPFRMSVSAGDPVDMATGAFEVNHTDLSLGEAEPRGIAVGTRYNSVQRYENLAGMAPGWVNNYYVNAQVVPAPQSSLGGTTPAQAAPMIAATYAALGVYNANQPNPKNWTVTALIAKWAIDQLNQKGVSVILGKDIVQFVQQPDGSFTPPANCTWTLTKPAGYVFQERHGNSFKFDSLGRLTNIVDQYSQPLNLTYNADNWVQTVTDWKGRSFTFNYSGTPSRLTSVTNNAGGRAVKYLYSAGGDLVSFIDAENKTNTFVYDGDHQIIATRDALNQLVTTNIYDPLRFGRVNTQYTQGDTNKAWQIYWSGWQTVVRDPAGSKQRFFYDDSSRLVAFQDALGNLSRSYYDGQDHVVMSISPLNETNQFFFDKSHNLLRTIDPLGFTNKCVYDNQNNLTNVMDARENSIKFGYNAQFRLTGLTNGAGDWKTFGYDPTTGLLTGRTNAGGATAYTYDTSGYLQRIIYPNSLGSEGFSNNVFGDVLSHTNARLFVTSFQYNLRRELTNIIAPTNLTAKVSYDAVGNLATATDARGFTTANYWTPTRKLLASVKPGTPQGVPAVTNIYDSRDSLVRTLNPLQKATSFTNDAAGRLVNLTDPLLRTTAFGYDADGRRIASTNAASEFTFQGLNARGEVLTTTDAASRTVKHTYDPAGNQITLTNRNGTNWQFQFDAANRLTNTIAPRGRETRLTYDARGLVSTVREPSSQTTTNFYDARNRLTNITDAVGVRIFTYDANNNLTTITNSGQALRLSQTFDAYDRMTSHTNAEGYVIQYRYDQNGNVTNLVYPGNRIVVYGYDSLNRLTNVTDWATRKTSIEYDLASRVKKITRPNGTVREINYDAAGQTTNVVERMTNGVPIAFFKLNWNSNSTVQWEFAAPLAHAYTPPTRTMTFDEDNRLATFNGSNVTNDADGNLTWGPLTNNTFASYDYDARNRLLGAGGVSYGYDPAGNRTSFTNGTNVVRFVINPNAALSQTLMRVLGGVTNYYIYGLGLLYEINETSTSTNTATYHYDYRGSTVALTDGNGVFADRIEYSPYGSTTYRSGTNDTPFLYNGRYGVQTEPNGLLYMRARFYNPYLCRFINADPAGFYSGLNYYSYANGNPVSMMDPFGLGAVESGGWSWLQEWKLQMSNSLGDMEWNDRQAQLWAQAHPTPGYQMAANMFPFAGAFVEGGRAVWSGNPAAMNAASDRLMQEGVMTLLTLGTVKLFGAPAASVADTEVNVFRQGTFADETIGWKGNYVKGEQWATDNPLTTPNYAQKYGLPAENTGNPDWVVGGRTQGTYTTRQAPASHNNPVNTGGATEVLPQNPSSVTLDWFHMPD